MRPTLNFKKSELRLEAHLLTGSYGENGLYGSRAGYYLAYRLREDIRFPDISSLRQQIAKDAEKARYRNTITFVHDCRWIDT